MDTTVLANQQKLLFINSVQTLDAIKRIYQGQWQIGKDGKEESSESVLLACLDDEFQM